MFLVNKKTCGEDMIFNEHLKSAICSAVRWCQPFNRCLSAGEIPARGSACIMIVIPKGEGDPRQATSWRGISKKSCVYKLFCSLIFRRLVPVVELRDILPEEQQGFRPWRSCSSACRLLLDEIKTCATKSGSALFAVFVDLKAAFDSGSRELARVPMRMLRVITWIPSTIKIDDEVTLEKRSCKQADSLKAIT